MSENLIAANLKIIRQREKLSMSQLQTKSGVTKSLISAIETGRNTNPTITTVIALANALDVSIEDFFTPVCKRCNGTKVIATPCPDCIESEVRDE
jgi:transcriptional regulator with XRE-family HTH domain